MSRSIAQLIRETSTNLANTILRRRENYLKSLPQSVSDEIRQDLRTANVFSESLFDEERLAKCIDTARNDATLASALGTVDAIKALKVKSSTKQAARPQAQAQKSRPVYATDLPRRETVRTSFADKKPAFKKQAPQKSFSTKGAPRGGRGAAQNNQSRR